MELTKEDYRFIEKSLSVLATIIVNQKIPVLMDEDLRNQIIQHQLRKHADMEEIRAKVNVLIAKLYD